MEWLTNNGDWVFSGIACTILSLVIRQIINKRGAFTYFVNQIMVGISTDDKAFGLVQVTWNGTNVANLYLSTVELSNNSLKDFENITISVCSNDTILLNERTEVVDTTHILKWTQEYSQLLAVPSGGQPTDAQWELHSSRRDYLIPTMNRGQTVRLHFLNASKKPEPPIIFLDVLHKGVKLIYHVRQPLLFGIPRNTAAFVGLALGMIFTTIVALSTKNIWFVGFSCFLFGALEVLPGVFLIKVWRKLRDLVGN